MLACESGVSVTHLVLLVGGRVLLVGGVVRGRRLGERGGGERRGERGGRGAGGGAAPVHLSALRQRHIRTCTRTLTSKFHNQHLFFNNFNKLTPQFIEQI